MKWTYHIAQKMKVALSLGVVIVLVLATSMLNERNFSELQTSFTSVYKDRLLVENYIYQLSELLHQKQRIVAESQLKYSLENTKLNGSIKEFIHDYEQTQFTNKEVMVFNQFKRKLNDLFAYESAISLESMTVVQQEELYARFDELSNLLQELSKVQIQEGENLLNESNSIVSLSYMISRIEIIIVIIVGLVIQALVLSSKSTIPKFRQNSNLN